jgi:hypothetical protein
MRPLTERDHRWWAGSPGSDGGRRPRAYRSAPRYVRRKDCIVQPRDLHRRAGPQLVGSSQSRIFVRRASLNAVAGQSRVIQGSASLCVGLPQSVCSLSCLSDNILARSRAMPARPYIARFSVFNRLIWPSTWPLLQTSVMALRTAAASWRSLMANWRMQWILELSASSSHGSSLPGFLVWLSSAPSPDAQAKCPTVSIWRRSAS